MSTSFRGGAIFAYGVTCYLFFFASFLYLMLFVLDVFVPRTVNQGPEAPVALAVGIDLGLIALFALQHTVMARSGFKRRLTQVLPDSAERSTFVLASSLCLALLFVLWRPIPGELWHVENPIAAHALTVLGVAGWLVVLGSSFAIDHFELFGLRQSWNALRGRESSPPAFRTPLPYRIVRHPLMTGILIAVWATPVMTGGHLVLAAGFTAYILIGLNFEERDLRNRMGQAYIDYQQRVPRLLPWPRKRARSL